MKKIKLILLASVLFALGSAFVTPKSTGPCDGIVYGKINPFGDDNVPANFKKTTEVTAWSCINENNAHCLYYYDEVAGIFKPCTESVEDKKFNIIVP